MPKMVMFSAFIASDLPLAGGPWFCMPSVIRIAILPAVLGRALVSKIVLAVADDELGLEDEEEEGAIESCDAMPAFVAVLLEALCTHPNNEEHTHAMECLQLLDKSEDGSDGGDGATREAAAPAPTNAKTIHF